MSSETFIAYFGLKFTIKPEEIESLELRSDWRIIAARQAGLKYYWGNFGGLQNSYLMFVGTQLGVVGLENAEYINIPLNELTEEVNVASKKLIDAGFREQPSFHFQLQLEQ